MNRRDFMKVAAASVLAASTECVNAKIFAPSLENQDKGIAILTDKFCCRWTIDSKLLKGIFDDE